MTNPPDQFPVLLLLMLGGVFGIALAKIIFVRRMAELRRKEQALEEIPDHLFNQPAFPERPDVYGLPYNQPDVWLAIRNRNVDHILEAFGMQNITPCTWEDGLENTDRRGIFVSPPIGGWTLVLGPRLPDLSGDVDALFRFITQLSARLGHVQYFHSNTALHHHAWVRSEYGRIHRAFAWTNQTIWNQGRPTLAEISCYPYVKRAPNSRWPTPSASRPWLRVGASTSQPSTRVHSAGTAARLETRASPGLADRHPTASNNHNKRSPPCHWNSLSTPSPSN